MVLVLLLGCTPPPPPVPRVADHPPEEVRRLIYGEAFLREAWTNDLSIDARDAVDVVAREAATEERALLAGVEAARNRLLAVASETDASEQKMGEAAAGVAAADRKLLDHQARTLCALVDALPVERRARALHDGEPPLLARVLPTTATNPLDLVAPAATRVHARAILRGSGAADVRWAPVQRAAAVASAELLALDPRPSGWCVRYRLALQPTMDAWVDWRRTAVSELGAFLLAIPDAARASLMADPRVPAALATGNVLTAPPVLRPIEATPVAAPPAAPGVQ